jgi:hypothetical protein
VNGPLRKLDQFPSYAHSVAELLAQSRNSVAPSSKEDLVRRVYRRRINVLEVKEESGGPALLVAW